MASGKIQPLPSPALCGRISVEQAIAQRRTVRDFADRPLSLEQISQLCWAAQGITDTFEKSRTIPSAGVTYPLEVFVVCGSNSIEKMGGGIYHYNMYNHSLTLWNKEDVRLELARAALDQEFIYEAPVDVILCAVYERTVMRYGSRGERYVYMEAGHAGQNIYLQATTLVDPRDVGGGAVVEAGEKVWAGWLYSDSENCVFKYECIATASHLFCEHSSKAL